MTTATLTARKFDRRTIALAAWSLVKTAGKTLSEGMKAAWAAAKQTIKTVMSTPQNAPESVVIDQTTYYRADVAKAVAEKVEDTVNEKIIAAGGRPIIESNWISPRAMAFGAVVRHDRKYMDGCDYFPVMSEDAFGGLYADYRASYAGAGAAYEAISAEDQEDRA